MTYLEIDLENLQNNIKNLKHILKNKAMLMAVVKANAYGHGLIECATSAISGGASWLGVVTLEEALRIRKENIRKPILVLGATKSKDARLAANQDISIAVFSLDQARELSEISFDKPLKIHLKIDTGLNRLGLKLEELAEVVRLIKSNHGMVVEGVYSHLASVEENDLAHAQTQLEKFIEALKTLKSLGIDKIIKHIAATAAVLVLPESHFDMVRCGIGIYGLWPSEEIKNQFGREDFLEPVLSFKTEIVQIKSIEKGQKIGYGCAYEANEDMVIGVIPVGYFEGLDRGLSNCGEVLVSGKRCPIVGRICMNMTIIDISKLKSQISKINSDVTIIGKDGDEENTADEIAEKLGTINYEVVARLPEHLERRYI